MKLTNFKVRDIGLIQSVDVPFLAEDRNSPRRWTILTGINGTGKTSLLQTLAIGLAAKELRSQVANLRTARPGPRGRIQSTLSGSDSFIDLKWQAQTNQWVDRSGATAEGSPPEVLVLGYGVNRSFSFEPRQFNESLDPSALRIGTLFGAPGPLLGPDFAGLFRSRKQETLFERYTQALRGALLSSAGQKPLIEWIDRTRIEATDGGFFRLSQDLDDSRLGIKLADAEMEVPFYALPQGCQSIVLLIGDILGQAMQSNEGIESCHEIEAIVLIDEIDLHLHPQWQRLIVPILDEIFPKVQFIVTTHSPLVLSGCESGAIFELENRRSGITVTEQPREWHPGKMEWSDLLSAYFGVSRAMAPDIVKKERRFLQLLAKSQAKPNRQGTQTNSELSTLQKELEGIWAPEFVPVRRPRKATKKINQPAKKKANNKEAPRAQGRKSQR